MLIFSTIFSFIKGLDLKTIAIIIAVALIGYFAYDYINTKIDNAALESTNKKVIKANKTNTKITKQVTKTETINEERKKIVEKAVEKLNKIKESKNNEKITSSDNFTVIEF